MVEHRRASLLFEVKAEPLDHLANGHAKLNGPERVNTPEDDDPIAEASESDEEELNPFEAFALTQLSQGAPDIVAEVNAHVISRADINQPEEDEEDPGARAHAANAKHHAQTGISVRASQATSSDVYGDDELDQLFRQTVLPGYGSNPSTPRRRGLNDSVTPSTRTAISGGSGSGGPYRRNLRLRDQAGLGELRSAPVRSTLYLGLTRSTILDGSSPSSPAGGPRTPTKQTPLSEKSTPNSLVRNVFARARPSPTSAFVSPSKRPVDVPARTVTLPAVKRTVSNWSPSPEEEEPVRQLRTTLAHRSRDRKDRKPPSDIKPKIEALTLPSAREAEPPPPGQTVLSLSSTEGSDNAREAGAGVLGFIPTQIDPPVNPLSGVTQRSGSDPRPDRKRVRLVGPGNDQETEGENGITLSGQSLTSAESAPTANSRSTMGSNLSRTTWQLRIPPPSARDITSSMEAFGVPSVIYQDPFYSNVSDVPSRAKMFGGRMFALKGNSMSDLQDFETSTPIKRKWLKTRRIEGISPFGWEFGFPAPLKRSVADFCRNLDDAAAERGQLRIPIRPR